MKIRCAEEMIVRAVNPPINLKFKPGETKEVPDSVGNHILKYNPDKFEKIEEE